jgi:exosortase A
MSANATFIDRMQGRKEPWAWHLAALAGLLALIVGLFWQEASNAVEVWWIYPTYSHCFLIIPIALWLIWEKRDELRIQTPALAVKALLAVPFVLAIWFMAKIATINEVRQIAVIGLVQIALLAMLGTRVYRSILFPALFLFFLVPVGQYLIPPMQRFATAFTDSGLNLLGIAHYTEGTTIELTTGSFEIAEACAGLRFLIATITLGVLFAHLTYRRWWKIAAFLAACVIVPLIANGFRCIGIIMLAYMTNNQLAVGADHIVYGWGFNVAILLVIFFVGSRFRDSVPAQERIVAADSGAVPRAAVVALAIATAVTISAGPAIAYWHENRTVTANARGFAPSLALKGWRVVPAAGRWHPDFANPDREANATLVQESSNAPAVDLAIVYYGRIREGHSLIATTNRLWDNETWHPVEARSISAKLGATPLHLDETIISSTTERRLVWSSYWMDERFTTSRLIIKLLQLKTAFSGNEAAALIAFSTPIDGAVEDARARLETALAAFTDLPKQLVATGREGAAGSLD